MADDFRISDMRRRANGQQTPPAPISPTPPLQPLPPLPFLCFKHTKPSYSTRLPTSTTSHAHAAPHSGPSSMGMEQGSIVDPLQQNAVIEDISLRQYWNVVQRYWLTIIAITIGISVLTIIFSLREDDLYRATATMLTQEQTRHRGLSLTTQSFYVETLVKIGTSMPVMKKASARIHEEILLIEEASEEDKVLARTMSPRDLKSACTASLDRNSSDIIYITAVTNHSGPIAAAIANAVANSLRNELQEISSKDAEAKNEDLKKLNDEKIAEIREIEMQIAAIRREHLKKGGQFSAMTSDQKQITYRLVALETRLHEESLKHDAIIEEIKASKRDFGIEDRDLSTVKWESASDKLDIKLENLNTQREEMVSRYTDLNPNLVKVDEQIKALEKTMARREKGEIVDGKLVLRVPRMRWDIVSRLMRNQSQLKGIAKSVKTLEKKIETLRTDLIDMPVSLLKIEKLKQDKSSAQELLRSLQRDHQREKVKMQTKYTAIRLSERALSPNGPFSPNRKKRALIGILLGLALGIAAAFLINNWDDTLKSSHDLSKNFSYPSLGAIPRWETQDTYISTLDHDSQISEVYGVLRNNIRYSAPNNPEKCLLIASSLQDEGKSHVAMNLAISFAQEGNKSLLICSDLRATKQYNHFRPRTHSHITHGLTDYLENKISIEDMIMPSTIDSLSIIPAGTRAQNPARLLKSLLFQDLLNMAQAEYEVIIIDSPAVLPVVDTTIMTSLVRGVLVLAQAGRTPLGAIKQTVARLEHVNSPIIGMALNKVKDARSDYFYGPGYNYNDKAGEPPAT